MLKIDMWYEDPVDSVDEITIAFYPNDAMYRGNLKHNGKFIGDFSGNDSVEISKRFGVKWND